LNWREVHEVGVQACKELEKKDLELIDTAEEGRGWYH
jgi:hypothetical protein